MMSRLAVIVAAGLLVSSATTFAATFHEEIPFTQPAFAAAQKANDPILLHVTAAWCSTCTAQKPIVDKLHAEPSFANYKVFNIDFDAQKTALRKFGVRQQSTLIVYKGDVERGRSTGDTAVGPIKALLQAGE